MAGSKRRDYGSGSVSQMKNGKWTARMVIGVNENGKPKIKALYGDTEREVKRKSSVESKVLKMRALAMTVKL